MAPPQDTPGVEILPPVKMTGHGAHFPAGLRGGTAQEPSQAWRGSLIKEYDRRLAVAAAL